MWYLLSFEDDNFVVIKFNTHKHDFSQLCLEGNL